MKIFLKDIKEKLSDIDIINYKENIAFSKFSHDTRELEKDSLYIPIVGSNSDGHKYIKETFLKGSVVSLCDKSKVDFINGTSYPVIVTKDVLDTLGKIMNIHRKEIEKDTKIIAVTGSTGKTTTREMICSILSGSGKVLHSKRNFNTLWGNAEILDDYMGEEYIVLEFGMDRKGEIQAQCKAIEPDAGVLLNIGCVHAQVLGNMENIFNEKRSLADFLSETNGFLALNIDDKKLVTLKRNFDGELMTFGKSSQADVRILGANLSLDGTDINIKFDNKKYNLNLKVLGKDYAYNACAAFCIGVKMGLSIEKIIDGLEKYDGFNGRFQIINVNKTVSIINDAYNANPTSMKMSIETFNELYKGDNREKILVLGDMKELGIYNKKEHRRIGKLVEDIGFSERNVYYLGEYFNYFRYGTKLKNLDEVISLVNKYIRRKRGSVFLIKGSHGTELYKVAELFTPSDICS